MGEEGARSRWVSPFLHSGPPTQPGARRLAAHVSGRKEGPQSSPLRQRKTARDGDVERKEEEERHREGRREDKNERGECRRPGRGGELQKLTLGALGGGAERDRMGPALGSLASWGRGGGRTIPAAAFRRPRGRAESRWGRPALPFLLVADAEAACGEAAPGPHQPQPGRTEAAAAGADPRPGQFFRHHRTPKHSVLLSQGFPLGWGHMLLWRPWPQGILTLRIPSQTPSRSQNAIFIATPRVCKVHIRLCKFHSRGSVSFNLWVCKFSLLLPHTPRDSQQGC